MKKFLAALSLVLLGAVAHVQTASAQAPFVPCQGYNTVSPVACTPTGPSLTGTGTPPWAAFGILNSAISVLWSTQTTSGTGAYLLQNGGSLSGYNLGIPIFIDLRNAINPPPFAFPVCGPLSVVSNNTLSTAGPLCNTTLSIAQIVAITGGIVTFAGSGVVNANQINSTTVPGNALADQGFFTSAPGVGVWVSFGNCPDTGGNHLNYLTASHTIVCGTSSSGGGGSNLWSALTAGTNAGSGSFLFGTGSSLGTTGSGTIAATSVPAAGIVSGTTTATLAVGAGGSLKPVSTGIIDANQIDQFAQYSPISILAVSGTVCDDIHDQSAAITTLVSQGVRRILIPAHCVVFLTTTPDNTELLCEDQTSVIAATPITGNIDAGIMSKARGCSTVNNFDTNSVQPKNVTKIVAGGDFFNMSDASCSGCFRWWRGESSHKIGPTLVGNYRSIGFTGSVGGATSGTIVTPAFLQANGVYALTFSDGEQRLGTLAGTGMSWTGALSAGSILSAKVDDIAFTASQGGASTGTLQTFNAIPCNPGNSPYWQFVFDEGGGVTETRTDVLINTGSCGGSTGTTWSTASGALAARTIYGAQVKSTDVPQESFVSTGGGDNVFFSTNTLTAGTANAMRVVCDAQTVAVTGVGSGNFNCEYMFIGSNSVGYAGTGIFMKDSQDGALIPAAQNAMYIQRIGNAGGAGGADTSIYIDDASYAGVNPASRPVIDIVTNSQGSGNILWMTQDTQAFSGDFFHVDANKTGAGAVTGEFLQLKNHAADIFHVDAANGNTVTTGSMTAGTNTVNATQVTLKGGVSMVPGTAFSNTTWQTTSPGFNIGAMSLEDTSGAATNPNNDWGVTIQAPTFTNTSHTGTNTIATIGTLFVQAPVCDASWIACTTQNGIGTNGAVNFTLGGNWKGAQININANSGANATFIGTGTTTGSVHVADSGSNNIFVGAAAGGLTTFAGAVTFSNATVKMNALTQTSASQTGTVCSGTAGILTIDTTTTCLLSAARFKEHITPLFAGDGALAEVMALKPVSYYFKPEINGETFRHNVNYISEQVGFVAEDVAKVDSRLVTVDPDGQLHSVRYQQMTALLAAATQEMEHTIERQQLEIYILGAWCAGLTLFLIFRRRRS